MYEWHPTHRPRFSFSASSYDEICDLCGSTDGPIERGDMGSECPASQEKRDQYDQEKAEKNAHTEASE